MSFRAIRAYATQSAGVRLQDSVLSVLAPRAPDVVEIFTQQKQGDREATVEKLENALLRAQLNRHNRKLVFSKRSTNRWAHEDAPTFNMELGYSHKEIRLDPRSPVVPLSTRDLRTISWTPQTPEEVRESTDLLIEFLKTYQRIPGAAGQLVVDNKVVDPTLFVGLLRRAANHGIFDEVYQKLQTKLGDQLTAGFFTEALRIYALRVPYLSSRSKSVLRKMHEKAAPASGQTDSGARDLLYAYGLAQYAEKFGAKNVGPQLEEALKHLQQDVVPQLQSSPRRSLKHLTVSDLVLGHEAVKIANLPEFAPLEQTMAEILQRVQGEKPVETAYVVDISDRPQAEASETGEAETGEAGEANEASE